MSIFTNAGYNVNNVTPKKGNVFRAYSEQNRPKNEGGFTGAVKYTGASLLAGIGGVFEGIGDILSSVGDKDYAKYRFENNQTGNWLAGIERDVNPNGLTKFAGDVASGIGQSSVFLLDAAVPFLGTGLFFSGIAGQGIGNAVQQTGELGFKEVGYGVASGALEAVTEKVLGAGGQVVGDLASAATQGAAKRAITKAAAKSGARNILLNVAKAAGGEFAEEFSEEFADVGLKKLFKIDNEARITGQTFLDALYAGAAGAVSGGLMAAPAAVANYKGSAARGRMITEQGRAESLINLAKQTSEIAGLSGEAFSLNKQAVNEKRKSDTERTAGDKLKDAFFDARNNKENRATVQFGKAIDDNLTAWKSLSDEQKAGEPGMALLGEIEGNLTFHWINAEIDNEADKLAELDDEDIQEVAAEIKRLTGREYTVQEIREDKDMVLRQVAAANILSEMQQQIDEMKKPDAETAPGTEAAAGAGMSPDMQGTAAADQTGAQTAENAQESPVSGYEEAQANTSANAEQGKAAGFAVNPSGKRVSTETGRQVRVKNVKTENGRLLFETEGNELYKSEVLTSDKVQWESQVMADAVRAAEEMKMQPLEAQYMIKGIEKGTQLSGADYALAFHGEFLRGKLAEGQGTSTLLSQDAKDTAYLLGDDYGKREALKRSQAISAKTTAAQAQKLRQTVAAMPQAERVKLPDGMKFTDIRGEGRKAVVKAADLLSKATGVKFELYLSYQEKNGGERLMRTADGKVAPAPNGWYDAKTGVIHIDLNAGTGADGAAIFTMAHETGHWLMQSDPEAFRGLGEFLFEKMGEDADALIKEKQAFMEANGRLNNMSDEKKHTMAYEEVVCDLLSPALKDGRVIEQLAYENRNLFQRVWDHIRNVIKNIRDALKGAVGTNQLQRDAADKLEASMKEVEDMFAAALQGAADNSVGIYVDKSTGENVRYSIIEEGVRYSDREYMDAVESGDMETAQRMVEEAAVDAGAILDDSDENPLTLYHGTDAAFTKFDLSRAGERSESGDDVFYGVAKLGVFATPNEDYARIYQTDENRSPMKLFGFARNIYYMSYDDFYNMYNGYDGAEGYDEYQGEDGLLKFKNEIREEGYDCICATIDGEKEYIFFNSEQLKSAETVTKDDSGKVIPLSERFNSGEKDIRYSDREVSQNYFDTLFTTMDDGRIRPNNVKDLSTEDWKIIYKAVNKLGYGMSSVKETKEVYSRYAEKVGFNKEQSEEIKKGYGIGENGKVAGNPDRVKKAKKEFGTTTDFREAGYLLTDGYLLDFSGKKYGGPAHVRKMDHREIQSVFSDGEVETRYGDNTQYMNAFISEGNIRLMDSQGVTIGQIEPNQKQYAILRNYIDHVLSEEGFFYLDLSNDAGLTIASREYGKADSSTSIVRDIKEYFKNGELPYRSGLREFMYSDRKSLTTRELLADVTEEEVSLKKHKEFIGRYRELVRDLQEVDAELYKLDQKKKSKAGLTGDEQARVRALNEMRLGLDDKLTKLEGLQQAREIIETVRTNTQRAVSGAQERVERAQREVDEYKEQVRERFERYREKRDAREQRNMDAMRERLEKERNRNEEWRDTYEAGEVKRKTLNIINKLIRELMHPTRDKNIPAVLQPDVVHALEAISTDVTQAEARMTALDEKIAAEMAKDAPDMEQIRIWEKARANIEEIGKTYDKQMSAIQLVYEKIKNSQNSEMRNAYDPGLEAAVNDIANRIRGRSLNQLTLDELKEVRRVVGMVEHLIATYNETMATEKKQRISDLGEKTTAEIKQVGGEHKTILSALHEILKFGWSQLKPAYAVKVIGSDTLQELYNNLVKGEDVWAVDKNEAKQFADSVKEKYHFNTWDIDKVVSVDTQRGKVDLTINQIMSLYAYSKRQQAVEHLTTGGFVLDNAGKVKEKWKGIPVMKDVNIQTPYMITNEDFRAIQRNLTDEQRAFVEDMMKYLSTTLAAKGNAVSRKLYGIDLFNEETYFPIKSARQFLVEENRAKGDPQIKNKGMTKQVTPGAGNPIVLSDFTAVWANHVEEMALYHGLVLPMEDMNRVLNWSSPTGEGVKVALDNAYGAEAKEYLMTLMKQLNGGLQRDKSVGLSNRMLSGFKRGATMASLSVVIQQPTSIIRSMTIIDPKYFRSGFMKSIRERQAVWDELKSWAPVALIKESGSFDVDIGASDEALYFGKEYGTLKEKAAALAKDADYRNDVLGKAPEIADQMAWCYMWEACKNKVEAETSLKRGSDEFMKKAADVFSEAVRMTQVYDSRLTRSQMMRSPDFGAKLITTFMAEPTTSFNMLAYAVLGRVRGDKDALKAIGYVVASILLNSILVSAVYAMRDDDEDKTYGEKYVKSLIPNIIDNANPLNMLPVTRDIVSLFQGYDVERADMSLVSDVIKAFKGLSSSTKSPYRKIEDFAGSVANIFGIPAKNVLRDVRGMINTAASVGNVEKTGLGTKYAILSGLGKDVSKGQQMYDAIMAGDVKHFERVAAQYASESAARTQLRLAMRASDERISLAAEARAAGNMETALQLQNRIIAEGHFDQDDVIAAVNAEYNLIKKEEQKNEAR